MERRSFLQMLCFGMAVASTAMPAQALMRVELLAPDEPPRGPEPIPGVATPEDREGAKIEQIYYGHWRRVRRRHYRRVGRRVYRRHYYYHHRPYYY